MGLSLSATMIDIVSIEGFGQAGYFFCMEEVRILGYGQLRALVQVRWRRSGQLEDGIGADCFNIVV